ncbi:MAG: hypothetical protein M3065_14005 [Actinomycetota bacterium]|nr:hypothetical protein [Actinomycetota bacterium]
MAGRTVRVMVLALALQGAVAAIVRADGLPVLGFASGAHGVRALDGTRRYVAHPRRHETIVEGISTTGRRAVRTVIRGRFDVPVVAYDGSASGLSANGHILVLIRPRIAFPQRSTELAVLAARTLRVRRFERLRGDFSFDAISPGGEWIYLIQYTSRFDPTRYRVRALSTLTGRLLARDIVDPHDRGVAMRGNPIARVSSSDGRWAYTLYDGKGHPFVHALDTARRQARCIDVAAFPTNSDWLTVRLRLTGERLIVDLGGRTLSEIDTRSLSLLAPARATTPTQPRRTETRSTSGTVGIALPIAAAALLLVGGTIAVRRRFRVPPRRAQVDRN